ncbi:MAG TPA: hypothetical protein VL202_24155 [Pararhizobium sp.]|uniref:hypothetical protein n=1 Tax=Pararhizobium sp. TaxID=1977563 RepID=UPI002CC844FD|nr:hypothetical protein [Pararhizobium sp.]HTO34237.1 hypothetical protein [Pararhizobium sp.]
MITYLFSVLTLLVFALIVAAGVVEHRSAIRKRHRLLDESHDLLRDPGIRLAPDQFPVVTGRIADGRRIRLELIADTMVTRRLPQLWLSVTLLETQTRDIPTLGALARPTGSEYYSLVHGLPDWMTPPATEVPLLMRGDGRATPEQALAARETFGKLFADPQVKEAVMTQKATRVIYQASQGTRAAHMFLRQAQFSLETVPASTIELAVELAVELSAILIKDSEPSHAFQAA